MNRLLIVSLVFGISASTAHGGALPGNSDAGQRLHAANCTGCHDTGVYTRNNRTVASLASLKERLKGCAHMAKKEFSPSEQQDLVKYLNDQFYHFN